MSRAVSDYHFHRRNRDEDGAVRWSDKNGQKPTRCCWDDPAVKDSNDVGDDGIGDDEHTDLRRGVEVGVAIATHACTSPGNYLFARPAHLLTVALGGFSPNICA